VVWFTNEFLKKRFVRAIQLQVVRLIVSAEGNKLTAASAAVSYGRPIGNNFNTGVES